MSDTFRVGIVGVVSSYTLYYAHYLADVPNVEVVAAAHLNREPRAIQASWNLPWLKSYPKTLDGYAERFGLRVYEQPEEMIGAEELDAVCITTEDYLRIHHALRATKQGVHVFVPKPFANNCDDAERMFDAANRAGVVLLGSIPLRFNDAYVAASQVIDNGRIGRPISGHAQIVHHLTLGGWKSDPTMAAGPAYEMGFYICDALRWLMRSEPAQVMALGANLDHHGIPYIDNGKCLIEFENGALGSLTFYMSTDFPFPARLTEIVGDEGALRLLQEPKSGQLQLEVYSRTESEQISVDQGNMHKAELLHWIEKCRTGANPIPWQKEALRSLEFCAAFEQACLRNQSGNDEVKREE
ncbi:Gfo/Idh/MocA family oxidoreductase [Chloroflexi bacterium TSY]|nr:Gfo/Idh/MocA family oxidoreductase [Chloroflexi bacterium TSY]